MQEGRERARKARAKRAVKRVRAFRDWNEADADYFSRSRALERQGMDDGDIRQRIGSPPKMNPDAAAVTDADYRLAREVGAVL